MLDMAQIFKHWGKRSLNCKTLQPGWRKAAASGSNNLEGNRKGTIFCSAAAPFPQIYNEPVQICGFGRSCASQARVLQSGKAYLAKSQSHLHLQGEYRPNLPDAELNPFQFLVRVQAPGQHNHHMPSVPNRRHSSHPFTNNAAWASKERMSNFPPFFY